MEDAGADQGICKKSWLVVQALSGASQWLDIFLIFSIPSFLWHAPPADIALVAAAFAIPSLVLGPFVGFLTDRGDSKIIMLYGATARTALTICIAFAPSLYPFLALVFAKGLANTFYWASSSVMTRRLVPAHARTRYYANLSALDQASKIAAPLFAGGLTQLLAMPMVFLFSGAIMAAATGLLPAVLLRDPETCKALEEAGSSEADRPTPAFGLMTRLPRGLLLGALASVAVSALLAVYDPHLAAYLSFLGFSGETYSWIMSSTALGAATAAILVRRVVIGRNSVANLMRGGLLVYSCVLVVTAFVVSYVPQKSIEPFLMALWFVNGFGYELFAIGAGVNLQNLCPRQLLGRVSTSIRSAQLAAVLSFPIFGAWLIAVYGRTAPFVFSAGAAVLLMLAGAALWLRPVSGKV
ncbi:MFS transporter [Xylophilus rhododendri]|nr:MFS transporter [Xylophilus rhododendri]